MDQPRILQRLGRAEGARPFDLIAAAPPRDLSDLVLRFTGYREYALLPLSRREMPRPLAVVIVSFGDPFELTYAHPQAGYRQRAGSFVAGIHDKVAVNRATGLSYCLQLDLTPLGARLLFGLPMHLLTNRIVPLDAIWGAEAGDLSERLRELPHWAARFDLVAALLRRRRAETGGAAADILWAWRQLQASGGTLPVSSLASALSVSRRHLAQRFREELGLPPKILARMLRFNRALDALAHGSRGDLAALALDSGYYDQAHFNRDFRDFAGEAPGAFLAR